MLPKENKLRSAAEISSVYKTGKFKASEFFKASYDFLGSQESRFAVVITKKYGKAVKRNKIRRFIFRTIGESELIERPKLRMIIGLTRKAGAQEDFLKYVDDLKALLAKV